MKITVQTINHNHQRYSTVGDYMWDDNEFKIWVSDTFNDDYNFLIVIHEMIEAYLCKKRGILEEDISSFDIQFEKEREEGLWNDEEPGDDPRSIYRKEHQFATKIERMLADEMNIDWDEYDKYLNNIDMLYNMKRNDIKSENQ